MSISRYLIVSMSVGRGGTQIRFSDNMDWWCARPLPREDMNMKPFIGDVSGVTPAVAIRTPELRRRDVGHQRYGQGIPKFNSSVTDRHGLIHTNPRDFTVMNTSHGSVALPSHNEENLGFLPTADAILFLKHEYLGSRAPVPPQRFFPPAWR